MLRFERVALPTRAPPGSGHALELEDDVCACRRRSADRRTAAVRCSAAEGQQRDDRHGGAGGRRESSAHGTFIVSPRARQTQVVIRGAG